MKLKVINLYLYVIIVLSFLGGYFETLNRSIYLFSVILIALFSLYFSAIWLSNNPTQKLKYIIIAAIILVLTAINFTINLKINTYFLFVLFSISLFLILMNSSIEYEEILRIINNTFLLYVFLSLLVYFNLIPSPIKLNIFYFNIFGIKYKTFIGFFGSTSTIDSYATIVFILNLISRSKKVYIVLISGIAAIMPLRFTPLLILLTVIFIIFFVSFMSKKFVFGAFILFVFLSFLIPTILYLLIENEQLFILLNYFSNGRVVLWHDLLGEFLQGSIINILFGFGSTENFILKTWDHETSNPHNVYFTLLITYGFIIYFFIYISLTWLISKLKKQDVLILIAILTAGISNSIIFSFKNLPLVLLFIYFISLPLRSERNIS